MGVKEAVLVGTILGGAGGAGGAYAADLGGIRTGGGSSQNKSDENVQFKLLDCTQGVLKDGSESQLNRHASGTENPHTTLETFDAKKGCLKIQLSSDNYDGKDASGSVIFELVAWDDAGDSQRNKGMLVWSSLSLQGDKTTAKLISRVFYLTKDSNKFVADKGLEFTTTIKVSSDKGLSGLLKEKKQQGDEYQDVSIESLKNKKYEWNSPAAPEGTASIFDKIKITSGTDSALFFGRGATWTSTDKLQSKITGVYTKDKGWQQPNSHPEKITLFKEEPKGTWTLNS